MPITAMLFRVGIMPARMASRKWVWVASHRVAPNASVPSIRSRSVSRAFCVAVEGEGDTGEGVAQHHAQDRDGVLRVKPRLGAQDTNQGDAAEEVGGAKDGEETIKKNLGVFAGGPAGGCVRGESRHDQPNPGD